MLSILVLSSLVSLVFCSSTPAWQDLNCEEGHRYLFSEVAITWEEARGECQLYGGWLVDLRSRREQNCLIRYAQAAGVTEDWHWHDDKHTKHTTRYLPEVMIVHIYSEQSGDQGSIHARQGQH